MKQFDFSGIVGWDVMPADLRRFLNEAAGDDVEVIISSPGGYVGDALEMFNLVRNYPGKTTAVLSGYAMSAASYVPLAADEIIAEDNAVYMIHFARGGAYGDHEFIAKYARETEALSRLLAGAYVRHTGLSEDDVWQMMRDETYFYGQEIVDGGFAAAMRVPQGADAIHDRDGCIAIASTAYHACTRKMSESAQGAADDFIKAVALAKESIQPGTDFKSVPRETNSTTNRAASTAAPATIATATKENSMDLKMLREKHPDLVAALTEEIVAGIDLEQLNRENKALVMDIMSYGAEGERKRIEDVRSQLIPGHEKLIATMELDGKSTGADAAKAIVAAEKEIRAKAAAAADSGANPPVPPAAPPANGKKEMKRADFNQLGTDAQRAYVRDGGTVID